MPALIPPRAVVSRVLGLPEPLLRLGLGGRVVVEGQTLDRQMQWLIQLKESEHGGTTAELTLLCED